MPSGTSCPNMYKRQNSTAEDPADIVPDKHDTLYAGNDIECRVGLTKICPKESSSDGGYVPV